MCLLFKGDRTTEEQEKIIAGLFFFGSQRSLLGLYFKKKMGLCDSVIHIFAVADDRRQSFVPRDYSRLWTKKERLARMVGGE